ncbi:MAG TPA: histone, partial [Paraburkholderia sp.]|nr:histone [Paraburkholderia sp.]
APAATSVSSAPAATVKTALNPAAAWPFPTGSRP